VTDPVPISGFWLNLKLSFCEQAGLIYRT